MATLNSSISVEEIEIKTLKLWYKGNSVKVRQQTTLMMKSIKY